MNELILVVVFIGLILVFWVKRAYPAIIFNKFDEENRIAYVTVRSLTGEVFKVKIMKTDAVVLSVCGHSLDTHEERSQDYTGERKP